MSALHSRRVPWLLQPLTLPPMHRRSIVGCYGIGKYDDSQEHHGGSLFIVQEIVRGGNLLHKVRPGRTTRPDMVQAAAADACAQVLLLCHCCAPHVLPQPCPASSSQVPSLPQHPASAPAAGVQADGDQGQVCVQQRRGAGVDD
jgi:hypothetical protein